MEYVHHKNTPILYHINLTPSHTGVSIFTSSCCTYVFIVAHKQVLESVFEGGVAEGVACRVDGAVDVAEPVANGPERVWDANGTEGVDQDHHVVRRPGDNKRNQDGHDGACDLFLSGGNALLFPPGHSALLCYLENESRRRGNFYLVFLK